MLPRSDGRVSGRGVPDGRVSDGKASDGRASEASDGKLGFVEVLAFQAT